MKSRPTLILRSFWGALCSAQVNPARSNSYQADLDDGVVVIVTVVEGVVVVVPVQVAGQASRVEWCVSFTLALAQTRRSYSHIVRSLRAAASS